MSAQHTAGPFWHKNGLILQMCSLILGRELRDNACFRLFSPLACLLQKCNIRIECMYITTACFISYITDISRLCNFWFPSRGNPPGYHPLVGVLTFFMAGGILVFWNQKRCWAWRRARSLRPARSCSLTTKCISSLCPKSCHRVLHKDLSCSPYMSAFLIIYRMLASVFMQMINTQTHPLWKQLHLMVSKCFLEPENSFFLTYLSDKWKKKPLTTDFNS